MTDTARLEQSLIDQIEAYGADPATWPQVPGADALALLADPGPRLAAAFEEARLLDAALGEIPIVPLPAGLERAILAAAPGPARSSRGAGLFEWPARLVAGAGAAFASLALGLSIGLTSAAPATASLEEPDGAVFAALGLDAYSFDLGETVE